MEIFCSFFFFYGIGACLGLLWVLIFFVQKLIKFGYYNFLVVYHVWKAAILEGIKQGKAKLEQEAIAKKQSIFLPRQCL